MAKVRNLSNISQKRNQPKLGAQILFAFFCLPPALAFCGNGGIGAFFTASSELTIVVPEHIQPLSVTVENNNIVGCGYFSKEITLLSVSGGSEKVITYKANNADCKDGQTFIAPIQKGGSTIFVPSSAL